ncbi:MAG: aminotransferase class III-fold pyridoxal phosphate-dependent enzyme [Myxococcota bacterium]|nr:aminotransferase class III-fold pyridoxal phosphate-dependent enzyme [Myxococcota bacterium]
MSLLDNLGNAKLPITLCSGEGPLLWDTSGQTYWDFYGGHAVTLLGHGHPRWIQAITAQARQLSFCTTIADVPVRTEAAAALTRFTGTDRAFLVNSGAEAVEGALKLARKATGRKVIVAMQNGFHGRTMGALGVTERYRGQHNPAHGDTRFVAFGDLEDLAKSLDADVAAVILEPIQGIAGVRLPPAGYLAQVAALCTAAGALLICDEVQCGMGRTGAPLVSRAMGVAADIVTLGKGIAGGFPAAAVLMTEAVAATVRPGEHGTTFGGAPMACAAIKATIEIIEAESLMAQAHQAGQWIERWLAVPGVVEIRAAGAWAGITLDTPARPVAAALLQRGFLVGTSGDPHTLRLAPPAAIPEYVVRMLGRALSEVLTGQTISGAA